jgi:hypothetical protein
MRILATALNIIGAAGLVGAFTAIFMIDAVDMRTMTLSLLAGIAGAVFIAGGTITLAVHPER